MFRPWCAWIITVMTSIVIAHAQSIYITVTDSGGDTTYGPFDGPDIDIPGTPGVPAIGTSVSMIRVYASDPLSQSIGHVTITTTRAASVPLAVLIAHPSQQPAFPENSNLSMGRGALDWSGLTCSSDCGAAVRLAAGVNGSIIGSVDVGQVFRLQAAGAITESVRASNGDGVPQAGFAVAVVTGGSISGNIEAAQGTIGTVRAESPNSTGITGDILAQQGTIVSVTSLSEIGLQTSLTPIHIEAKLGIGSIEAKAINADIKADVNNGAGVINLVKATGTLNSGHFKGALRSQGLEAGSGESGVTLTGKLAAPITLSGSCGAPIALAGDCAASITIVGDATAPITIGNDVLAGSNISARTFRQPITVSGSLKSSITTTGVTSQGEDGIPEIEQIVVGSIDVPSSNIAPVISATLTTGTAPNQVTVGKHIGSIKVGGKINGGNGTICRIQCARLDELETGIASDSGDAVFLLAKSRSPLLAGAEYTALGTLKVRGALTGLLRVATFDYIECEDFAGTLFFSSSYGPQPSGFPRSRIKIGRNNVGQMIFNSSQGLKEHIVMNRHGEDGGDFGGFISVKQPSGSPIVISSPTAGVPAEPSSLLGGGSIALWPYQLYPVECLPSGFLLGGEQTSLTAGEFTAQTEAVQIRFTGPIYTTLSGQNPVQLEFVRYINGMTFNTRIDDGDFIATIPSSPSAGSDREIRLVGDGSYRFAPGLYRVSLNPDVSDPVLCGGIVDASGDPLARPVAPFVYYFWLANDCDPCICAGLCTVADYDGNGGIDGGDLAAFFTDFEAGLADVDMNGGVDGGDIATFFCWFEQGGC
jgi:hypothetical protein